MTKPRPVHFAADSQPGTSLCGALTRKRTEIAADVTCADCLAHPRIAGRAAAAPVELTVDESAAVAKLSDAMLAAAIELGDESAAAIARAEQKRRLDAAVVAADDARRAARRDAQALAQCTGSTSVTVRHERRELDGSLTVELVETASAPKLDRELFRSLVAQGYSREHATKRATR